MTTTLCTQDEDATTIIFRLTNALAESQARETVLREALNKALDYTRGVTEIECLAALRMPHDDTALRASIAKELRSAAQWYDEDPVTWFAFRDELFRRANELEGKK